MPQTHETFVLAIDVGNTVTRFGLFALANNCAQHPQAEAAHPQDPCLLGLSELITQMPVTADECRLRIADALSLLDAPEPDGIILSCVVPSVVDSWRLACKRCSPTRPLLVSPGLKTGIRIGYDDPSELGSDRVANVVGARMTYGSPVVVVDMGTTTNIEVVNHAGVFVGGVIAPGIALGAQALAQAAAKLPQIELRAPSAVIGSNTRAAMQSGVVLGEAARIDGLLDHIEAELYDQVLHRSSRASSLDNRDLELDTPIPVVLTGDAAASVASLLTHDVTVDDALTLRGLALLWALNARR